MTLEKTTGDVGFSVDAAPVGGLDAVKSWAADTFDRLSLALQQPRPQSLMLSKLQPGDAAFVKPSDGLFVFAAADAAGAGKPEGLYMRIGGAWKQVTLV